MKEKLTKEMLNRLLEYRDGEVFWKENRSIVKKGDRAGFIDDAGYIQLNVNYTKTRLHRIVWVMFNGEIPAGYEIDHKDNNRQNNRIDNLRLATRQQNLANTQIKKRANKSGYKGVHFSLHSKKWCAQITVNWKMKTLGLFNTPELAHEAYKQAAIKFNGEFAKY